MRSECVCSVSCVQQVQLLQCMKSLPALRHRGTAGQQQTNRFLLTSKGCWKGSDPGGRLRSRSEGWFMLRACGGSVGGGALPVDVARVADSLWPDADRSCAAGAKWPLQQRAPGSAGARCCHFQIPPPLEHRRDASPVFESRRSAATFQLSLCSYTNDLLQSQQSSPLSSASSYSCRP